MNEKKIFSREEFVKFFLNGLKKEKNFIDFINKNIKMLDINITHEGASIHTYLKTYDDNIYDINLLSYNEENTDKLYKFLQYSEKLPDTEFLSQLNNFFEVKKYKMEKETKKDDLKVEEEIQVIKRDGKKEKFDPEKIIKTHLNFAFQNLKDINPYTKVTKSEFINKVKELLKKEITTEEIKNIMLNYAKDNIEPWSPEYNYISARILLKDIEHRIYRKHGLFTYSQEAYQTARKKLNFSGSYKTYLGETYKNYVKYGIENNILSYRLLKDYTEAGLIKLGKFLKPENDLLLELVSVVNFEYKYLKKINGNVFELPQWRLLTVAAFIALAEKPFEKLHYKIIKREENKKEYELTYYSKLYIKELLNEEVPEKFENYYQLNKYIKDKTKLIKEKLKKEYHRNLLIATKIFWAKQYYEALSNRWMMVATPTLSNAGTINHQLSSCFQGRVADSIEGIFDEYKEFAIASKYGGGGAKDYSLLRNTGGMIFNVKNVSKNVVSWMKIDNDIIIAVDQLGTRKGAMATYLGIWEKDIDAFIELKRKSGDDRLRAYDLFNGIVFPKIFFEVLERKVILNNKPGKWYLLNPYDCKITTPNGFKKDLLADTWGDEFSKNYIKLVNDPSIEKIEVDIDELWLKILDEAVKDGTPYHIYKFNHNKTHTLRKLGPVTASNLCVEMSQYTKENLYGVKVYLKNKLKPYDVKYIRKTYPQIIYKKEELNGNIEKEYLLIPEELEILIDIKNKKFTKAKYLTKLDKLLGKYDIEFIEKDIYKLGHSLVCNLASINVDIPEDKIEHVSKIAVRMLDNVITLNKYPTYKFKVSNEKVRSIGVGKMNLYKYIVATKGLEYDSEEAIIETAKVMSKFSKNEIEGSIELVIEGREKPEYFEHSEWKKGKFYYHYKLEDLKNILSLLNKIDENTKNKIINEYINNRKYLENLVKKYGIRNLYIQAIAPTGSISLINGSVASIEPVFKKKWYEEASFGLIPVIAPGLSVETWERYKDVFNYSPISLIPLAATVQCYVDQSISYSIYYDPNKDYGIKSTVLLSNTYILAHKLGMKSIYYLRSKSPEQEDTEVLDRSIECTSCQ